MSQGPESSIQEAISDTLSVSDSTSQLLPKKTFRKSADSASKSEAGDPTKFAERSLLRSLIIGRKVSQARKYFAKVFSHLQKNLELSAFFTAHEFICLVKDTPVAAALYAKANFGPELRDRHILIYDAQKKIMTVTVKELLALLAQQEKPQGRLEFVYNIAQLELFGDVLNTAILSDLEVPQASSLEKVLCHFKVLSQALVIKSKGFQGVYPKEFPVATDGL